jgi:hypothetical protein
MKATTEVHGLKPIFKNGGSSGKKWVAPSPDKPDYLPGSKCVAYRVTYPDSFDYTLKGESLKLIKVKDDGRVSQLQDISPGVYSLKLAGTRTGGCGFKGGSDGAYR